MPPSESTDEAVFVRPRTGKRNWAKQARSLHFYLGTFFAPAILFFALTGAVQLFGLHEAHPERGYAPFGWLEKLGQVHIHQRFAVQPKRTPPPPNVASPLATSPGNSGLRAPEGAGPRVGDLPASARRSPRAQPMGTRLSKWFFLFMSLGLVFTTSLGIYLAFKLNRNRGLVWALLVGGTLLPIALLSL